MQAFSLDHGSGIPLKMQVKAHIKYQVVAGLLRPGDQLPPLRDLAAGLGINLNTVVRAVDELAGEGYLYSHRGKGVFVSEEFPGMGCGAALRSLLAGVLQPAREWGISTEDLALALLAHGQLARPPRAAAHRLLLVGGARPQLRRLQGELEATLPVVVDAVLAEEAAEKARTRTYRTVACTLFHAEGLRHLLPGTEIITLAGPAAGESFASLSRLPPGTTVVIASRDWLHAARVRNSLELAGLGGLHLQIAAGQTPAALAPALEPATFVIATADCREIVREVLSGRPDVSLLTEPVEISTESAAAIRRSLGVPAPEQRVQVRSAWV